MASRLPPPPAAPDPTALPPNAASTRLWRVVLGVLALSIAGLALTPDPPPQVDTGWDKTNHLAAFAALGWAARGAAGPAPVAAWRWLAGVMAYGVLIEILQTQVPGRHAEMADLVADAVGLVAGWLCATWGAWARHRLKRL